MSIAQDGDSDGVDDSLDNCTESANPDQRDSDGDGFGNICDADLDNSGLVSFADLDLFRAVFGTNDADADLDGSGLVSFADLSIFKLLFNQPPGPGRIIASLSPSEAARFLTQSTFGPTLADINHLLALGGYEAWLSEQFLEPVTLQLPAMRSLAVKMCEAGATAPLPVTGGGRLVRAQVWWEAVVNSNDQLRQRVLWP